MKQRIGIFVLTLFFVFSLTPISGYASDLTPSGDFCSQADCWIVELDIFYECINNDTYRYERITYRCRDGSTIVITTPPELFLIGACPYSPPNN